METLQANWVYLLSGAIGVLIQVLLKIKDLKTHATAANMQFVFKKYLKDDWPTILLSFISIGAFVIFLPEITAIKPDFLKFARITFAFIGFTGSSIIQIFFSATSKKILSIIDLKTNIADGTVPQVTPENKEAIPEVEKGDTTKKN
jgi:hypothetical protein